MQRYWKVFLRIAKLSLMGAMIYRVDLLIGSLTTLVYLIIQVALIHLLFFVNGGREIGGFDQNEMYLVLSLGQVMWFCYFTLAVENIRLTREQIMTGGLDIFLLKPMDSRFLIMFQKFGFTEAYMMVIYLFVYAIFVWWNNFFGIGIDKWLLIGVLVVLGTVLLYLMYWISCLLFFFLGRFMAMWWLLNNVSDINRYPMVIYPYSVQLVFTFVFPLFLALNPVYDVLSGEFTIGKMGSILLMLTLYLMICLYMWKEGLKRYQSAG